LLHRLDGEVDLLPYVADACNESDNLAEGDSLLSIAILDHYNKGVAVYRVQAERNLGQHR
jgi:hypothetical protein